MKKEATEFGKFELSDSAILMNSKNYKHRFMGEYLQLKLRYEKLKNFNNKIEVAKITGTEEPKHDCPLELLKKQQNIMGQYLGVLEQRALIENIDLIEQSIVCALGFEYFEYLEFIKSILDNENEAVDINVR